MTVKINAEAALAFVLKDEGGYAERNTEGGGAVNMGITFQTFAVWRKLKNMLDPTFADLKAMPVAEAKAIYAAQYMQPTGFDDLPIGVDYVVFDAAVNGGVTGSIKLLQQALGLKPVDGHYGLNTRWAARHRDRDTLIDAFCNARLTSYKKLRRFSEPYKAGATRTWGDIWSARIKLVAKRAKTMGDNHA
jgi:lysozyme family protein